MTHAYLQGADLREANLQNANLQNANLQERPTSPGRCWTTCT